MTAGLPVVPGEELSWAGQGDGTCSPTAPTQKTAPGDGGTHGQLLSHFQIRLGVDLILHGK